MAHHQSPKPDESVRWICVDGRWVAISLGQGAEAGRTIVMSCEGRREVVDDYESALKLAKSSGACRNAAMSERSAGSEAQLVAQLHALGLPPGAVVVVHSSYKAVGPVAGGPRALIAALRAALGPDGTLVMPSMSDDDDVPFDARTTPCRAMGIVPETFRQLDGVLRSDNPASFAAAGPHAATITAPHPLSPPHGIDSPVGRACALGGYVLLLGIGHDANTTLHLAESLAAVPYRTTKYCTVLRDGAPVRVTYDETDHCCQHFARADAWLRDASLQRESPVGHAPARLMRATDVVRLAVTELRRNPFVFLCAPDAACAECAEARASAR